MTKEKFMNELQEYEGSYSRSFITKLVKEFFDSSICIPKGENRHLYADVLHEWIEGRKVEVYDKLHENWTDAGKECIYNSEYRIKPSEPVYEYLWLDLISPDTYGAPISRYMTHNEAFEYFKHSKTYICVKETERERR